MSLSTVTRWDMVGMCVSLAFVFAFEMLGVFKPQYVTITAIVKDMIPAPVRAMILGWLAYHFMRRAS